MAQPTLRAVVVSYFPPFVSIGDTKWAQVILCQISRFPLFSLHRRLSRLSSIQKWRGSRARPIHSDFSPSIEKADLTGRLLRSMISIFFAHASTCILLWKIAAALFVSAADTSGWRQLLSCYRILLYNRQRDRVRQSFSHGDPRLDTWSKCK